MQYARALYDIFVRGLNQTEEKKAPRRKKQAIPKALRDKVWSNAFGDSMVGMCRCGSEMRYNKNYECGHIIAEAKGGATIESNLRPVCRTCNRSMGTTNMNEFFKRFGQAADDTKQETTTDPIDTPDVKQADMTNVDTVDDALIAQWEQAQEFAINGDIENQIKRQNGICDVCKTTHLNRKVNLCNECRKGLCDRCMRQCNAKQRICYDCYLQQCRILRVPPRTEKRIRFGEHKGRTYYEIYATNRSYIDWLLQQDWFYDRQSITDALWYVTEDATWPAAKVAYRKN